MMKSQIQAQAAQDLGSFTRTAPPKRDLYANHIEIRRRDHDAEIRFSLHSEDDGAVVTKITVPLGALEGLT